MDFQHWKADVTNHLTGPTHCQGPQYRGLSWRLVSDVVRVKLLGSRCVGDMTIPR
jgi:hypothetical protein